VQLTPQLDESRLVAGSSPTKRIVERLVALTRGRATPTSASCRLLADEYRPHPI
jgi:hypothetical protein